MLSWPADGGWLRGARHRPSPNADDRPSGTRVDLLVIHYISLPAGFFAGPAIEQLFSNTLRCDAHPTFASLEGLRVSSHFLIRRHGGLLQFVDVDRRAWHAGVSSFQGRERCNDFSVGVELEGDGERDFTTAQYRKLDLLIAALRARLPLRWIAGHSDIAPGRKPDPGPRFDWARVAGHGLDRPQRLA